MVDPSSESSSDGVCHQTLFELQLILIIFYSLIIGGTDIIQIDPHMKGITIIEVHNYKLGSVNKFQCIRG